MTGRTTTDQPISRILPWVTPRTVPGPDGSQQIDYVITNTAVLTQTYDPAAIAGLDERRLSFFSYDSPTSRWIPVLTVVDRHNHTAWTPLDRLGDFALMGQNQVSGGPVVILDPDHGGASEPGGTVTSPQDYIASEKDLNLQTALQVKSLLDACGVKAELTRYADLHVDPAARAAFINTNAPSATVTIAYNISSHTMSSFNGGPMGLVDLSRPNDVAFARRLVGAAGQYTGLSTHRGVQDARTWRNGLALPPLIDRALTYGHIELGFMDNWQDRMIYQDHPEWYAQAVYSATLQLLPATSCTVPPPPTTEELDFYRRTYGFQPWINYDGDPVNMVTGQAIQQQRDVYIRAPGFNLEVERTYNSFDTREGLFGPGWTSNLDIQLHERESDQIVVARYPDGYTPIFFPRPGGQYQAEDGVFDRLVKRADGTFILTRADQIRYEFDAQGRPQRLVDRLGNTLTFTYDGDQLKKITDTVSRSLTFLYDGDHIRQITDPLHRTWVYTYNDGYLASVQDANGGVQKYTYDKGRITHFTDAENIPYLENKYDDQGRVYEQIDASKSHSFLEYTTVLSGSEPISATIYTDNLGGQTIYLYDERFRVLEIRDPLDGITRYGYNSNYHRSTIVDPNGNPTHYRYDDRGNLVERIDPPTSCVTPPGTSDVTRWRYDEYNQVISMTNALDDTWLYHYDESVGTLLSVKDPISTTLASYNPWGLTTVITDALGRVTNYDYDQFANRDTIVDAAGHVITSTYDIAGRERTYTDANGHTVTFSYDKNDNVTGITDTKHHSSTFEYDRNDLLVRSVDRRGVERRYRYDENLKLIAERDFPAGFWTYHGYDKLYRQVALTDTLGYVTHYSYDALGRTTAMTDTVGAVTRYEYDANGNLLAVTDPLRGRTLMAYNAANRLSSLTDAAGYRTTFCYDLEDRLISTTGPRGEQTSYTYDSLGRLLTVTDAQGNIRRNEHDPLGNQTAQVDPLGQRTDYRYDVLNRITAVERPELTGGARPTTRFDYDPVGNTTVITSPLGFATTLTYDENDNIATIIDPLGGQTSYTYDEEDQPLTVADANGHTTSTTYNEVGLPIKIRDGRGFTTTLEYDPAYDLVRVVNGAGHPAIFEYDPMRRLIRQTDALGNDTLYQRDLLGRITGVADANNNVTRYSYDVVGRLAVVTDARGGRTSYAYDEAGNLIGITDANEHTTLFKYSLLNQVLAETNPIGNTWRYAYDPAGRLAQRVDAQGRATFYDYDSNDRLTGIQYGAPPQAQPPVIFDYDLDGNQTRMCDGLGCSSQTYDALDRRTSTTDWLGRTIRRSYDGVGNLAGMIYPNGRPVLYAYNENNQVIGVTDPRDQISIFERDPLGQVTRILRANDTTTSFGYDPASRLTGIDNRRLGAVRPQSAYAYTLDKAGNRTHVRETRAAFDRSATTVTLEHSYEYDALNRLTRAATAGPNSSTAYHFDAVGNRLQKTGTVLAPDPSLPKLPVSPRPQHAGAAYNEANQLLQMGDSAFGYNPNGDRTRETRRLPNGQTETTDYGYDREDRLVTVRKTVDGTVTMQARYEYDGYGRRARKTVSYPSKPAEVTTYLYDGLDIIGARVQSGSQVAESYYYLAPSPVTGMRRPFEMERLDTGKRYWFQTDGLDSVIALTDERGDLVNPLLYDEYGQMLAGASDVQLFTYTAQDYDAETGLLHFYARYYDPARGVWLTQDAYRGEIGAPGTMQRYGYVGESPTTYIDEYGYWFGVDDLAYAGVGALGGAIQNVGERYIDDVVENYQDGKRWGDLLVPQSSWQLYTRDAISGAAGGAVSGWICGNTFGVGCVVGGGAAGGAVDKLTNNWIDNIWTKENNKDSRWNDNILRGVPGAAAEGIFDEFIGKASDFLSARLWKDAFGGSQAKLFSKAWWEGNAAPAIRKTASLINKRNILLAERWATSQLINLALYPFVGKSTKEYVEGRISLIGGMFTGNIGELIEMILGEFGGSIDEFTRSILERRNLLHS